MDYLSKLEEKLDYTFERVEYQNFSKVLQDAKDQKIIDLILEIQRNDIREEYLNFYEKLFHSPYVIVGDSMQSFGIKLKELNGKNVAMPKGFAIIDYVKEKHPTINVIDGCKNDLECLQWVQKP